MTASGILRAAMRSGMPDPTPNSRASYDAVDTTARSVGSPRPPTMTGRPASSGRRRISTAAMNWSMSTCSTQGDFEAMSHILPLATDVLASYGSGARGHDSYDAPRGWEDGAVVSEPIKTLPLVFEEPRGRGKPPRHLADLTPAERKARLEELGLPGFRARQLSTHYFSRLVDDPEQMTDLPAGQRAELVAGLLPNLMTALKTQQADKGATRKTLWRLFDGALVESVLMRYPGRVTMCVSSQAG